MGRGGSRTNSGIILRADREKFLTTSDRESNDTQKPTQPMETFIQDCAKNENRP